MFYLTTYSTHFILWLYVIRHIVKDHSYSKKGNMLLPHRLLFLISSKGSFICIIPQTYHSYTRPRALAGTSNGSTMNDRSDELLHSLCYTRPRALAGTSNGSTMNDRSDDPLHHEQTLLRWSYISLHFNNHEELHIYTSTSA